MKSPLARKIITVITITLQAACAFNYPQEQVDAELFLPIIAGFDSSRGENDFDYTENVHAFRISKALENQYISTILNGFVSARHFCSMEDCSAEEKSLSFRITKILEPFDWQPLEENRGIFKNARGGVLFGRGVRLNNASLLTLRYVLSPLDDERYTWSSSAETGTHPGAGGVSVDIPYRYVELREIALSDEALSLFNDPQVIYKRPTGSDKVCPDYDHKTKCDPKCHLCDEVEVIIPVEQIFDPASKRVRISATRKTDISFSDDANLSPVRYSLVENTDGWIDVFSLSAFTEGATYMEIVASLMLVQAGDCDRAYTLYKEKIEADSDPETRNKVLTIIAHLHGQSGGDITRVLDDLREIRGEEDALVKNYEFLNGENQRQNRCSTEPSKFSAAH